ncbi:MAG TPA: nucleoside transporter C-terminal domain-containing protein [Malonomonas sp.]
MPFQGLLGVLFIICFAWAISENRRKVEVRPVVLGLALQFGLALALLKFPPFKELFLLLNQAAMALEQATMAGTSLVFGYLGGGELPFAEQFPGAAFILAFRALPLVLVVSALSALLFYWRVLPAVVRIFSGLLQRTLGIGGAVGVGAAANIFVGMIEAPLLIKPYLGKLSRSELFTIMTCGMSTIAGTVLFLYAAILQNVIPEALGQILTASIISAPAAIVVSRLMIPQEGVLTDGGLTEINEATSSMDAITRGTTEGLGLLLNIVAMLIVLVALVALTNLGLGLLPDLGGAPISLQRILGILLAPFVWLLGIPWSEALTAGSLLGTKTILNEFIAYLNLAGLPEGALSPKSRLIMTYALCGFANFGSLGIMIGGMGTMAPERRSDIVALGMKSILAGTLATCMTGAIVGLL